MTTFTTDSRAARICLAGATAVAAIVCGFGVSGGAQVMGSAPALTIELSETTSVKAVSVPSAELLGLIARTRTGNPADATQVSPMKFGTGTDQ
jgi:hypothetical protein